ncbi:hypothetical protein OE88DRAFT_1649331 [Heliocybe sulcata]|uniref:Uncharacterized protein n=1 Tax=Heliocybe sulcata TaxID=5364 RepID=A0A5C3MN06_9AGAM|nr:hypothetical protein OE88DRAFT_1649331 [Heliocybe sulcata]
MISDEYLESNKNSQLTGTLKAGSKYRVLTRRYLTMSLASHPRLHRKDSPVYAVFRTKAVNEAPPKDSRNRLTPYISSHPGHRHIPYAGVGWCKIFSNGRRDAKRAKISLCGGQPSQVSMDRTSQPVQYKPAARDTNVRARQQCSPAVEVIVEIVEAKLSGEGDTSAIFT